MKKIIGLLLLFTILIFAEQNSTIQVDSKKTEKTSLLETQNRQLKNLDENLQNKIEELTSGNIKTTTIKSIPELKISIKQPTNWYLILLPITTIIIVIIGFLITRQQLINTSQENINQYNNTLKHQLELSKKENISKNRKEWIHELRDEIINMLTILHRNKSHLKMKPDELKEHHIKQMMQDKSDMMSTRLKIMLLLNTNEEIHIELNDAISDIVDKLNSDDMDIERELAIVIIKSQDLLKEEWNKVKNYS